MENNNNFKRGGCKVTIFFRIGQVLVTLFRSTVVEFADLVTTEMVEQV